LQLLSPITELSILRGNAKQRGQASYFPGLILSSRTVVPDHLCGFPSGDSIDMDGCRLQLTPGRMKLFLLETSGPG
jgi:hypothetical protein